jgi:hypothetical protein
MGEKSRVAEPMECIQLTHVFQRIVPLERLQVVETFHFELAIGCLQ